jgi:hypothetical protein
MKHRYATRYGYDTDMLIRQNFKKIISDTSAIHYLQINFLKKKYKCRIYKHD